jgi:hypothetical protein
MKVSPSLHVEIVPGDGDLDKKSSKLDDVGGPLTCVRVLNM